MLQWKKQQLPVPHTPEKSQCYVSASEDLYGIMNQALLTVPQRSKCQERILLMQGIRMCAAPVLKPDRFGTQKVQDLLYHRSLRITRNCENRLENGATEKSSFVNHNLTLNSC